MNIFSTKLLANEILHVIVVRKVDLDLIQKVFLEIRERSHLDKSVEIPVVKGAMVAYPVEILIHDQATLEEVLSQSQAVDSSLLVSIELDARVFKNVNTCLVKLVYFSVELKIKLPSFRVFNIRTLPSRVVNPCSLEYGQISILVEERDAELDALELVYVLFHQFVAEVLS